MRESKQRWTVYLRNDRFCDPDNIVRIVAFSFTARGWEKAKRKAVRRALNDTLINVTASMGGRIEIMATPVRQKCEYRNVERRQQQCFDMGISRRAFAKLIIPKRGEHHAVD